MTPYTRKKIIGDCTLYLGDCLDIMPTLGKVDAVVTDPPYGIELGKTKGSGGAHGLSLDGYGVYNDTYDNFTENIVPRINMALDMSLRGVVWTGSHIHEQRKPNCVGGIYYPAGAGRHGWGFKTFLPVLYYGNAPEINKGAPYPNTIQSSDRPEKNGHPVPKPLGWMKWNVNIASRINHTILDPFMGSGTTGVACVELGRKFIGIEIDEKYFDIACELISRAERQGDLFRKPAGSQAVLFEGS